MRNKAAEVIVAVSNGVNSLLLALVTANHTFTVWLVNRIVK